MCNKQTRAQFFRTGVAVVACCLAGSVGATDLIQSWQLAVQNDMGFAASQAAAAAGATQRDQARSLWLPQAGLTATVGRMGSETRMSGAQFDAPGFGQTAPVDFNTSIREGSVKQYELGISQPLLDRQRLALSRQLQLSADSASLQLRQARQQLMLRTAEHYFDVTLAQKKLELLQAQQQSILYTLQQTRDRFVLGDIPVTDTHEASAHAEDIKVQLMVADTDLQIKQAAYLDLTGQPATGLRQLRPDAGENPDRLETLELWLDRVRIYNFAIQSQEKTLASANEHAAGHSFLASPTVTLVGNASHDSMHGGGRYGASRQKADNWMVGLQLRIPVFTGGYRSAKYQEALHLRDQARAEGHHLRQQLERQARLSWLSLKSGASKIQALLQAVHANTKRLKATRLGHAVGDKTTLELLDAENALMSAQFTLLQAQTMLLLEHLRLASLAGSLDEAGLMQVNRQLQ